MKQKQEDEKRAENETCHNNKCQNKRQDKYKYCEDCLGGIREVMYLINQSEQSNRNILVQCNKTYGTQYSIIYPNWNIRLY